MNATTRQPTENWAGASATTDATTPAHDADSLADSLATAERARDTDPSTSSAESTTTATTAATSTEAPTTETPTVGSTTADSATDEVSVPTRLPEPETTIYRDSTTVIRLLQTETMTDAVEVRLYRAADAGTDSVSTTMATDGGRRESVDVLSAPTRQRFETAVDAVADRFDLAVADDGRLRARRDDHGRAGILEFAARLTDR
ncbi:hypothetical protein [Halonotius roseus]|uniref:Uncharacterized protein n=1 Tax=Halonotius roseus TaxID=2511997 RepID=A0A544QNS9_9EURY|nr:hypothetical protein [Halonotius roseus]TQQ80566.1 hypothetical protein EWF95_08775 [Halonotius roseus]